MNFADLIGRAARLWRHELPRAAQLIWQGDSRFGECPVWHEPSGQLFWVDIPTGVLRAYHISSGAVKIWPLGKPSAGLVCALSDEKLIVGQGLALLLFDPANGSLGHCATVPGGDAGERINDLAIDGAGSLWVATMDNAGKRAVGRLMRQMSDGSWETMLEGVPIMNGPAFDAAGATGYACDTINRRVLRFDVPDRAQPLLITEFARFKENDGFPDGVEVDAVGNLWVAHYAGGCITQWDASGKCLQRIAVSARNATSVARVGDDLYITSAGNDARNNTTQRDGGGGLFVLRSR